MTSANNGRWLLCLLDDWAVRSFQRLVEAAESEAKNIHSDCDAHARAERFLQEVLESALRRKQARRPEDESLLEQLRVTQWRWMKAVQSLADDNELDIPWPDGNGRIRPACEIIIEAILDDAAFAGKIAEIRYL